MEFSISGYIALENCFCNTTTEGMARKGKKAERLPYYLSWNLNVAKNFYNI